MSLVKDRPSQILPEELAAVEAAVERHPKAGNYRVAAKRDRIRVYERVGPDAGELLAGLQKLGMGIDHRVDQVEAVLDRWAQFTPVLRFILADAEQRTFRVERMCYRSSVDG